MRYMRPEALAWYLDESGEEAVLTLCEMPNGVPHVLVGVAAAVWLTVVDVGDWDSTIDALVEDFGGEREVIAMDAQAFVEDLLDRGLLATG